MSKNATKVFHSSDFIPQMTRKVEPGVVLWKISFFLSGYKMNVKFYWKNDYFVLLIFFQLIYHPPSSLILKAVPWYKLHPSGYKAYP